MTVPHDQPSFLGINAIRMSVEQLSTGEPHLEISSDRPRWNLFPRPADGWESSETRHVTLFAGTPFRILS